MSIPLTVGLVFVAFGVYLLNAAWRKYKKALASENWPHSVGTLIKVELWGKRLVDGEMQDAEKISVEYEYHVEEKSYKSVSIAFYTLMYPETYDFSQKNTLKSHIKVFYNPSKPGESVLITGLRKNKPYSDLILASSAIVVGGAIAVMAWFGLIA